MATIAMDKIAENENVWSAKLYLLVYLIKWHVMHGVTSFAFLLDYLLWKTRFKIENTHRLPLTSVFFSIIFGVCFDSVQFSSIRRDNSNSNRINKNNNNNRVACFFFFLLPFLSLFLSVVRVHLILDAFQITERKMKPRNVKRIIIAQNDDGVYDPILNL